LDDVCHLHGLGGEVAGLFDCADVEEVEEGGEDCFLLVLRCYGVEAGGLHHGLGEGGGSVVASVCGDLVHDTASAGRLAKYSHSVGVTAEEMDVLLDPFQRHSLVVQTKIRCTVALEGRSAEPSESAESVVEGDVDDVVIVALTSSEQARRVSRSIFGAGRVAVGLSDLGSAMFDTHVTDPPP